MDKEPYMHMIPKPMSIDLLKMPRKGSRSAGRFSTDRVSNCQVFPILDPNRKTKEDKYVLSEKTRSAIQQISNKRYCTTGNAAMLGDNDGESNISSSIIHHRGKHELGFFQKSENYNLPGIKHTSIDNSSDNSKTRELRSRYSASFRTAVDVSRNKFKSKENKNIKKFAKSIEHVQLHPKSLIRAETLQMSLRPDEMCEPIQEEQYRRLLKNGWNSVPGIQSDLEKSIYANQKDGCNTSRQKKLDFKCHLVNNTYYKDNLSANSDKILNVNYSSDEDDRLSKLDERNCGDICNGPILKCNICQQICSKDERGGLICITCQYQESNHALMSLNRFNQNSFSGTDFIPGTYCNVSSSTNSYVSNDDNTSSFLVEGHGPGYNRGYSLDSTFKGNNSEDLRRRHCDKNEEGIKFYGYNGNEPNHACTVPAYHSKICIDSSNSMKSDSRHKRPYSGNAELPKVHDSNAICPWSDMIKFSPSDDSKTSMSKRIQTGPKKTVCFSSDLVKGKQKRNETKDSVDKMPSQIGYCEVQDIAELPNYRSMILDPPFSKTEAQTRFHEDFIDPIPDLRDFHIYSKRIKLCDFNTCVFRGYNSRLSRLVPPLK
ncbi:hypothetical protein ACJMK2_028192 [Sinanodonta woodiana]|uniref:Uncharacterized protein n=1 Tax=Sinanodonta woodiana TaxID=1069815 RepID=A0ABD3XA78_SINWO